MIKRVINEQELIDLLLDSYKLKTLYDNGVDNWVGYEYALNDNDEGISYLEYEQLDTRKLLKDYPIAIEWME